MLRSLYVKNLAIIEELDVSFESGLNIITGETGAGKSIIISAIKLLLGDRFARDMIRTGENRAVIEGEFTTGEQSINIRRIFNRSGKSNSYLNDEPITLERLKIDSLALADLHGQHDHQLLLNPANHLTYLDAFGNYQSDLNSLSKFYSSMIQTQNKLLKLQHKAETIRQKKELYQFQLRELELLPLESGLDEQLEKEYEILSNAAVIREKLLDIFQQLEDDDLSLKNQLGNIIRSILSIAKFDVALKNISGRFENMQIELDDLAQEITFFLSDFSVDESRLAVVSEQLEHVEMLKRKYGGFLEKVIEYRDKIKTELDIGGNYVKQIQSTKNELGISKKKYSELSQKISLLRNQTALKMEKKISAALQRMKMNNTKFQINLTQLDDEKGNETGINNCEFFISANIGEILKPLVKIASGGEISRIMLAIKMVLQKSDMTGCLIFDEIDSGISGSTAEKIGNILVELSQFNQVICITHLSQIAGKGKSHYRVYKHQKDNRTCSYIDKLDKTRRIDEIATLISGDKISDSGRAQAIQLMEEK